MADHGYGRRTRARARGSRQELPERREGHLVLARRRSTTSASASCTWSARSIALRRSAASSRSLVRLELLTPGKTIMSADDVQPGVHAARRDHGVPLHHPAHPGARSATSSCRIMLGAKDVAFPQAQPAVASTSTGSARSSAASPLVTGGVDTGWTFYTPYSHDDRATRGHLGRRSASSSSASPRSSPA